MLALGIPVLRVTIDASATTYPGVKVVPHESRILYLLAGPLAEAKATKRNGALQLVLTGIGDIEQAALYLERIDIAGVVVALREGRCEGLNLLGCWIRSDMQDRIKAARRLVNHLWSTIEKVARALLECGTLTADELADLAGHDLPSREIIVGDRAELHRERDIDA